MSNVYTSLSAYRALPFHKGDIGLEIETETRREYEIPQFAFWDVKIDNSLRNFGREYVLRQPLNFDITQKAIEEFAEKTKGIPFIQDSITTSVHVHLNFLNQTFMTLGNFITVYSLVENLLTSFCGDQRKYNMFCLPLVDAEQTVHNIVTMFEGLERTKGNYAPLIFEPEHTKYAALNLSALRNFGSLEQRSHGGSTDPDRIKQWLNLLYSIYKYAQKEQTPHEFIEKWQKQGSKLLDEIFGEHKKLLPNKDLEELLEINSWFAVSIACSVNDWKSIDASFTKKKASPEDNLNKWAKNFFNKNFDQLTEVEKRQVLNGIGGQIRDVAMDRAAERVRPAPLRPRRDAPMFVNEAADAALRDLAAARPAVRFENAVVEGPLEIEDF